ncbi:hypothetical protein KY284_013373 [Solanum tuberosum]|nr:hypothetical protein KY284_013373 [Solanum tuberosum]
MLRIDLIVLAMPRGSIPRSKDGFALLLLLLLENGTGQEEELDWVGWELNMGWKLGKVGRLLEWAAEVLNWIS